MPAIITHDTFGQDIYHELYSAIGGTRGEYEAFLLGNQGPDPFFYNVADPRARGFYHFGSMLHDQKPDELLRVLKDSLEILDEGEYFRGRAYALGFLCHYVLDSTVHPFIFATQHSLCDAGVKGLSRSAGHEVHATIESELDEMVLFVKRGETVAAFNPSTQIIRADEATLDIVSRMYAYIALVVYGCVIPGRLFAHSVHDFRHIQSLFYSPTGAKRALLGDIEGLFRRHSFFRSMSHRPLALTESAFDNRSHAPWTDPFTGDAHTEGFWDLYESAYAKAADALGAFASPGFDAAALAQKTDFSGRPTGAVLTVEDGEDEAHA